MFTRTQFTLYLVNVHVYTCRSVFPCGDAMVAIIDDREDVWSRCPNLIHVKPYVFFAGTADINAPPPRPSTTPTSTAAMTKPSDEMPFKVRHITSSRNNNIKPPVAIATRHSQASNESVAQQARESKLTTTEDDTPAIIEQATSQSTPHVPEKESGDSNDRTTSEIHAKGEMSSTSTSPSQTDPDHGVHSESEDMKSGVPNDYAPVEISDNCELHLVTKSNSNENNNNGNGDDPSNKKEGNSSSSSDSSSSSEEEEGDGDRVEQEDGVRNARGGESRDKRETSSSSSSSSSSGIDDNLFDTLDENIDDPDRNDSEGATATVAEDTIDTSKMEGAYMVARTEKLVREPAEGMEVSMIEQDINASSRERIMEKTEGLTASGECKIRMNAQL